ncbi:MATE family efflux transporter [uncultured Dialister sp.]|uniref:MATE family efflux transporter n=1 Tax=uncultured Dialister sp. TaxID=278064 RepID=UPI0025F4718A|nr:MATE family efflux transporter [uncultured Dialister sp.]
MNHYDRHYLRIALPAALEGLFMILLSSTDLILVSALGSLSVAAVSIFLQPRLVLLCFSRSLASAVTLVTSRRAGAGEQGGRDVPQLLKQSLTLCAATLGVLHILAFIFMKEIFLLMGAKPDYLELAMEYGPFALLGVYFTSLTLILQAVQLGYGDTAKIMKVNVGGNILNAIFSFLLIRGFGPFPALGVEGAAIGTAVSTLFSLILAYCMLYKDGFLTGGKWIPDQKYFDEIVPIFSSVLSEQGSERIGMVLFSRMAAGMGTVPFAVHSICMNICDVYWDFIMGFGKANMVEAGQAMGSGSKEDWHAYKRTGFKWSMLLSAISCGVTWIFSTEIFSFYSTAPDALAMSGIIMLFVAIVSFPESIALWGSGILRGSGYTGTVAAYSFMSVAVIRPIMTAIFLYVFDMGIVGTWIALLLDQCIRAACSSYMVYLISHEKTVTLFGITMKQHV